MHNIMLFIVVASLAFIAEGFRSTLPTLRFRARVGVATAPSTAQQRRSFQRKQLRCLPQETLSGDSYEDKIDCVEKVISTLLADSSMSVKHILCKKDTLDITLANSVNGTDTSPTSDELDIFHRSLNTFVQNDSHLSAVLEGLQITVGSPGIGDVLQTDRDFETFKGFDVNVHTSEVHHKQTNLSGKLIERTKDHLFIMQKGRKLKIPRGIVVEVKMPPSLYEDG